MDSKEDIDITEEILEIDETDNSVEEDKKTGKYLKFVEAAALLSAFITMCYNIFLWCLVYNPKERELSDDNLFSNNDLIVSEVELNSIINNLEEELGIVIDDEDTEEYALLNAVCENDNLADKEKDICYKTINLIKDNPYLDKEEAYRSLRNVDVSYKYRPFNYDKTITGVYLYQYESIGIFEKDEDFNTLFHEIIHCIYSNEKTKNLPQYFKEGMTELLTNEYFSETPFLEATSYPFEIAAVKMLCEVTSPDTVLKAFSCGDMDIIAEEMSWITRDIEEARSALNSLENIFLKAKDSDSVNKLYQELSTDALGVFRGIVNVKYAEGSLDRECYYYNEIVFSNLYYDFAYNGFRDNLEEQGNCYKDYIQSLYDFGIKEKAYFSSDLIEKFSTADNGKKVLTK